MKPKSLSLTGMQSKNEKWQTNCLTRQNYSVIIQHRKEDIKYGKDIVQLLL